MRVQGGRVTRVSGDRGHPANFGRLCSKGFTCAEPLTAADRLAGAFAREHRAAPLEPLALDDALGLAAARLQTIIARDGPDAVALYVSGQLSMESQYLAGKLAKGFLRTNNIDSNSRLCMASAASGYKLSLGADGPPGSYQDIDRLDCALVIGANMAECHPILFLRLLDRRKSGARIIVVDPRRTPTAEKADLFLQIGPGTDLALLNGILHLLAKAGRLDPAFIARHTVGWDELRVLIADYPPERVAALTGLPEAEIRTAADWIGAAPEFTTFWTMGLNQSIHGTWQTNAICNLHLATGKICRPGSGPFSLTGQPNAMGGREVGYLSHTLPGQRSVLEARDRAEVERLWDIPAGAISPRPGLDAVALFQALGSGGVKAVWIIGTNPVASMPNRSRVVAALRQAELVIVQDAFHPTETTRFADLLLPGALWAEAEGTMVNSERTVTLMPQAVDPPGEARADWRIIAGVAQRMGFGAAFAQASAAEVFDEIRRTANPRTGYDLRGMDYGSLREQSQQWPRAPGAGAGAAIRYVAPDGSLRFPTESGRACLLARPYLPPVEQPDAEFPFTLTNGRLEHQWHTLTKTGKVAALNQLNPGPFLQIHPVDAEQLGVHQGALVRVRSRRGFAVYPAAVTTRVRPGECFAPIHWNEMFGENLAVNEATSDAVDPISLQPGFKFTAVALTLAAAGVPAGFSPEQTGLLLRHLAQVRPRGQTVPATAPFTAAQREFINRLVAGSGELG